MQIHAAADAAVVGSAIVKKIEESIGSSDLSRRVGQYVSSLIP